MNKEYERSDRADSYIILYDGVCGLCNRLNRFVLNRDTEGQFQFASLQSEFARKVLASHDQPSSDLNTLYLVRRPAGGPETLLSRAPAVLHILNQIGGTWCLAALLRVFPTFVLDFAYNLVAKNRYRLFGKLSSCPLPDPRHRSRFIT